MCKGGGGKAEEGWLNEALGVGGDTRTIRVSSRRNAASSWCGVHDAAVCEGAEHAAVSGRSGEFIGYDVTGGFFRRGRAREGATEGASERDSEGEESRPDADTPPPPHYSTVLYSTNGTVPSAPSSSSHLPTSHAPIRFDRFTLSLLIQHARRGNSPPSLPPSPNGPNGISQQIKSSAAGGRSGVFHQSPATRAGCAMRRSARARARACVRVQASVMSYSHSTFICTGGRRARRGARGRVAATHLTFGAGEPGAFHRPSSTSRNGPF